MKTDNFEFIDLFCGIGGLRIPFDELGGECVFSSDFDEDAQDEYKKNFNERPVGDIKEIEAKEIPEHNLLLAGFPCQAFSIMGDNEGFADTRGTLFFDIERILEYHRPPAFLLENVKNLKSHNDGKTFEVIINKLKELDYFVHWDILNALDYGTAQKRERTFIVGFQKNWKFEFPEPTGREELENVLQNKEDVPEKYFATDYMRNKRQEQTEGKEKFYPSVWHENKGGNVGINDFACALRASASHSYQLVNGIRRFTPREMLRLQGFPEWFDVEGSETKIRKLLGNSVPIPVVREIAKKMFEAIESNERMMYQSELPL